MGYVVLHLDKSPDNEVPMTAHIARTKMPSNAIPELTYLNEELVEFPEGVADRTEAINHRLEHAGLTRKIGTNQVRVIRVMLTGTQEDMQRIVQEGRLKAWCADNLEWLRRTFGAENVVSAVLHMDEATPHIHAAVVPIVTGERRKVRKEKPDESGKRKYRTKSASRPRLCADDVMSRAKLKEYQDTYAAAMSKYGLQRGIDGSEARHVDTQQFYREMFVRKNEIVRQVVNLKEQQQTLTVDIAALQAQQEAARSELAQTRREIKTNKLKGAAVDATAKAVERIGALFHDAKSEQYQQQIADKDKRIEELQQENTAVKAEHEKETFGLKQQLQQIAGILKRIDDLFPYVKGLLKWENYCKTVGLNKEQTRALFTMQPYRYTGELHSIRYGLTFKADDVVLQFKSDKDGPGGFRFTINGKEDDAWFRQQRKGMYERIGIDIEKPKIGRNLKI